MDEEEELCPPCAICCEEIGLDLEVCATMLEGKPGRPWVPEVARQKTRHSNSMPEVRLLFFK